MFKLPIELEKEIFKYLNIKCHTCHVRIKTQLEYENCIILDSRLKFIFCSQECHDFI